MSILASCDALYGNTEVIGRRLIISGLGQIGDQLATRLTPEGTKLTVRDVSLAKKSPADSLYATWVASESAITVDADVFTPRGLGASLTPDTIKVLRVKAVWGPANNQRISRDSAAELAARGILWAPDSVVTGDVVIFLEMVLRRGIVAEAIAARMTQIGDVVTTIFHDSPEKNGTTLESTEQLGTERLNAA